MKHYTLFIAILLGLFILSCSQAGNKNSSTKSDTITNINDDKEQIVNLVKQVLKWHENNGTFTGFDPMFNPKDSVVIGMNLNTLKEELNKFTKSNLFDNEFIDNYKNIFLKIDKKIKSKEIQWHDGDMPPYGSVDPWCSCQDYPYDNPWDKIEINFTNLDKESVILTWTWGNSEWSKGFNYKVKAKKIDGTWKISYLQGFDINEFIK